MNKDLELVLVWLGNMSIFLIISYAVFIGGFSGWWFLLLLVVRFTTQERWDKKLEELDKSWD